MLLGVSLSNIKGVNEEAYFTFFASAATEYPQNVEPLGENQSVFRKLIFMGVNGAGKSSILSSVDLLAKLLSGRGDLSEIIPNKFSPDAKTSFALVLNSSPQPKNKLCFSGSVYNGEVVAESLDIKSEFGSSPVFCREGRNVSLNHGTDGKENNEIQFDATRFYATQMTDVSEAMKKVFYVTPNTPKTELKEMILRALSLATSPQRLDCYSVALAALNTFGESYKIEELAVSDDGDLQLGAELFRRFSGKDGLVSLFDEPDILTEAERMSIYVTFLSALVASVDGVLMLDCVDENMNPVLSMHLTNLWSKILSSQGQLIMASNNALLADQSFRREQVLIVRERGTKGCSIKAVSSFSIRRDAVISEKLLPPYDLLNADY